MAYIGKGGGKECLLNAWVHENCYHDALQRLTLDDIIQCSKPSNVALSTFRVQFFLQRRK